jgi:parallel beta-helix repeat protein
LGRLVVVLIVLLICPPMALFHAVKCIHLDATIVINADGSIDPPTASISTVDNVTYTITADINDQSIFVQRNNITIDGRGNALQGSYANFSYGISLSKVTSVTVENMRIEAFWCGIFVDSGSNHSIFGDNIANNVEGIFLQSSANDWIFENNITSNNDWGVVFFDSHDENLFRNNITNNVKGGVWLAPSFNDDICENNIANNMGDGIALDGYLKMPTLESSTFGNKITNNDIKDNTGDGIRLVSSTDNTISGNKITLNYNVGISLNSSSSHNKISGNNITKSTHGIWLCSYSNHNSLIENRVTANSLEGIKLEQCFEMNIVNNDITDNNLAGIWLSFSNSSLVSQNRIERNYPAGIILDISSNNTILENDVRDNHVNVVFEYSVNGGVGLSSGNRIFHNDFINGTWNAVTHFAGQSENFWDGGYPSGGNYWSDYNGTDTNHDGIGDTPYVMDANNIDHYPLMNQYVIPEFPSILILPLFMIATLLAITVCKRRRLT